ATADKVWLASSRILLVQLLAKRIDGAEPQHPCRPTGPAEPAGDLIKGQPLGISQLDDLAVRPWQRRQRLLHMPTAFVAEHLRRGTGPVVDDRPKGDEPLAVRGVAQADLAANVAFLRQHVPFDV